MYIIVHRPLVRLAWTGSRWSRDRAEAKTFTDVIAATNEAKAWGITKYDIVRSGPDLF